MHKEEGSISAVLAALFGLFFIISAGFGAWAFSERQSYKNDVDAKIETAVDVATEKAKTAKDTEFVEQQKLPTRTYTGSATYGSLTFAYPKTWSVYAEDGGATAVDVYAHPDVVPGLRSGQPYALRVEVVNTPYDQAISANERYLKDGTLTATAFRAKKVPDTLGTRFDGQLTRDVAGAVVYLPLRDRTIRITTQSPQFLNDFNNIILPSITFVP
jgi:hypothetical protein